MGFISSLSHTLDAPLGLVHTPAFAFVYNCLSDAAQAPPTRDTSTTLGQLVEHFQNAVFCTTLEGMGCLMLIESHGVKGACERMAPVIGARAKAHLAAALGWVEKKVNTPGEAADNNANVAASSHHLGFVEVSLNPFKVADQVCRTILGNNYQFALVSAVSSAILEPALDFGARSYLSISRWASDNCKHAEDGFRSHSFVSQLVFDLFAVGLCILNNVFAFLSACTGIQVYFPCDSISQGCGLGITGTPLDCDITVIDSEDALEDSFAQIEEVEWDEDNSSGTLEVLEADQAQLRLNRKMEAFVSEDVYLYCESEVCTISAFVFVLTDATMIR